MRRIIEERLRRYERGDDISVCADGTLDLRVYDNGTERLLCLSLAEADWLIDTLRRHRRRLRDQLRPRAKRGRR